MCSNDEQRYQRVQEQHFQHIHPEFSPVLQGEYLRQMKALGLLISDLRLRVEALEKERGL